MWEGPTAGMKCQVPVKKMAGWHRVPDPGRGGVTRTGDPCGGAGPGEGGLRQGGRMTSRFRFAPFLLLALGAAGCVVVSTTPAPDVRPPGPVRPAAPARAVLDLGPPGVPAASGPPGSVVPAGSSEPVPPGGGSGAGAAPGAPGEPGRRAAAVRTAKAKARAGAAKTRAKNEVRRGAAAGTKTRTRPKAGPAKRGKAGVRRPVRHRPKAQPRPRSVPRPKARPRSHPRPSYDMRHVCAAAHGVVDPAVAALCPRVGR